MSRLSDYLRRRRISPSHHTRRSLARFVEKRGFVIGDYTYGAPKIMPWGKGILVVGKYTSIGPGTTIFLGNGDHHPQWITTYPFREIAEFSGLFEPACEPPVPNENVRIGSDVWIGAFVTILPGVTIGDGAIVGASAVVAGDIPPYGVVVGNPARLVRRRFSDATVEELLKTRWWEFERATVVKLLPLLASPDIQAFLTACAAAKTA